MSRRLMLAVLLIAVMPSWAQQRKGAVVRKGARQSVRAVSRPKMPIEYVAEYNYGATNDNNDNGRYMSLGESRSRRPKGFHIPTIEEWCGVFPLNGVLSFQADDEVLGNYEVVEIAGETYTFESDYQRNDRICYALRFKDESNKFLCAYRFKRIGEFIKDSQKSGVEVRAIYLGPTFKGSLETISNEAYWKKNQAKVVKRYFPLAGYFGNDFPDMPFDRGTTGYYWSNQDGGGESIIIRMDIERVRSSTEGPWNNLPLRLFTNE